MNEPMHTQFTTEPMTLEQMQERRDELEESIASLKAKLAQVRARRHESGEWADPDWYRRAVTRLNFTNVEYQQLCRRIGEERRRIKSERAGALNSAFVGAARDMLGIATFEQIMAAAKSATPPGAE